MTRTGVVQSIVLFMAGAGVAALGFVTSRHEGGEEIVFPEAPLRALSSRLEAIEALLRASARETAVPSIEAPAVDARRVPDEEPASVLLLREIRDRLSALSISPLNTVAVPGGVEKNAVRIVQVLDTDKRDPKALLQRHFCWSRAQVYAAYGMPDYRGSGIGASEWMYVLNDGGTELHFNFVEGLVNNVYTTAR